MKAGDTWDVPGVAFANKTGSENSIGPGILSVSCAYRSGFGGGRIINQKSGGDIHQ